MVTFNFQLLIFKSLASLRLIQVQINEKKRRNPIIFCFSSPEVLSLSGKLIGIGS